MAQNGGNDCLIKTQDIEKQIIMSDTCPVLEVKKDRFLLGMESPINGSCDSNGSKVAKFIGT